MGRRAQPYLWLAASLAYDGNGGASLWPGVAAFGNDTESPNRWRRTFAHEIGHNYGLDHIDMTTAGRHWFDVYERVIKPVPASVGGEDLLDFMVPEQLESEAWISVLETMSISSARYVLALRGGCRGPQPNHLQQWTPCS